jgi:hypothetical protein
MEAGRGLLLCGMPTVPDCLALCRPVTLPIRLSGRGVDGILRPTCDYGALVGQAQAAAFAAVAEELRVDTEQHGHTVAGVLCHELGFHA